MPDEPSTPDKVSAPTRRSWIVRRTDRAGQAIGFAMPMAVPPSSRSPTPDATRRAKCGDYAEVRAAQGRVLTTRFDVALAYAATLHRAQTRKGTAIPYVAHLLSVSALVIEDGGDEDEAIAGLLHDAVEDQGGRARLEEIRAQFGDRVAEHQALRDGRPHRVFCASYADVFEDHTGLCLTGPSAGSSIPRRGRSRRSSSRLRSGCPTPARGSGRPSARRPLCDACSRATAPRPSGASSPPPGGHMGSRRTSGRSSRSNRQPPRGSASRRSRSGATWRSCSACRASRWSMLASRDPPGQHHAHLAHPRRGLRPLRGPLPFDVDAAIRAIDRFRTRGVAVLVKQVGAAAFSAEAVGS
jgi:hypothetical protein